MTDGGQVYTLKELVRVSRANRRTLVFWIEAGVVMADPATDRAGSGSRRVFSRDEAIITAILNAFSLMGSSIGKLEGIARTLREQILPSPQRDVLYGAIEGRHRVFIVADDDRNLVLIDNHGEGDVALSVMRGMNEDNFLAQIVFLNPVLRLIEQDRS